MKKSGSSNTQLGQLLVDRKVISLEQLTEALTLQRATGNRLASECFIRHFATEKELVIGLSAQFGVPGVALSGLMFAPTLLDEIPQEICVKQCLLPILMEGERVFIAMADPLNAALINEISFFANRHVLVTVALKSVLLQTIERVYAKRERQKNEVSGEIPKISKQTHEPVEFVWAEELDQIPTDLLAYFSKNKDQDIGWEPLLPLHRMATEQEVPLVLDDGFEGDLIVPFENITDDTSEIHREFANLETFSSDEWALPAKNFEKAWASDQKIRVVVVEDDPEIRHLIVRLLKDKDMLVKEASRGLEALNLLTATIPDLIVLDAMLPEVHGFDICRKLKASERYERIPIIMVSSVYRGWRIAQDLKESYGVDAFLEKPFSMASFVATVEKTLTEHRKPCLRTTSDAQMRARELGREGMQRYRQGDLDGAIQSFREGLSQDSLSYKLHYWLGILFMQKKGMHYQVINELEDAVTLRPDLFPALRALAIIYQRQGFKNKAIEMWERAMRACPESKLQEKIKAHLTRLL